MSKIEAPMSSSKFLTCFKSYDVRGEIGEEFNEEIAYSIGRASVQSLSAKLVVVGFDARETSSSLAGAVAQGVVTLVPTYWILVLLVRRRSILLFLNLTQMPASWLLPHTILSNTMG